MAPGGEAPREADINIPHARPPWAAAAAILASLGGGMMVVVTRWEEIEPVINSPASIVISMLTLYGLGGFSSYWLLARPHEERLHRAEGVINRLRERERDLMVQIADLGKEVASLSTEIRYLKERLDKVTEVRPVSQRGRRKRPPPRDGGAEG